MGHPLRWKATGHDVGAVPLECVGGVHKSFDLVKAARKRFQISCIASPGKLRSNNDR